MDIHRALGVVVACAVVVGFASVGVAPAAAQGAGDACDTSQSPHQNYRTQDTLVVVPNGTSAPTLFVGIEKKGVFKSTDGGATWARRDAGIKGYPRLGHESDRCIREMGRIVADPGNSNHLYLVRVESGGRLDQINTETAGIYETSDGGLTWTQLTGYNNASGGHALAVVAGATAPTVLMGVSNTQSSWAGAPPGFHSTVGVLYKSTNGGQSWTELDQRNGTTTIDDYLTMSQVFADATGTRIWGTALVRSLNGGMAPDTMQAGYFESADGGATWIRGALRLSDPVTDPAGRAALNGDVAPANFNRRLLIATNTPTSPQAHSWYTTDGLTWRKTSRYVYVARYTPHDPAGLTLFGYDPFSGTPGSPGQGVLRSIDGGATWSVHGSLPPGVDNESNGVRISHFAFHPTDPNIIYAGGSGASVWRSTNGGVSWTTLLSLTSPVIGGPNTSTATAPGAPGVPTVTSNGQTLTVTWAAPTTGGLPASYIVESSASPTFASGVTQTMTSSRSATITVPTAGAWYVRVSAVGSGGVGNSARSTAGFTSIPPAASLTSSRAFVIGTPTYTDIWVDPVGGNNNNSGATRAAAVNTVDRAWRMIPVNTRATPFTTTGYRIRLVAGTYPESNLPNYWDERFGSATAPIVIEAADGPRTAILQGDINMANVAYVYVLNLDIVPEPAGDAFHCESCDHILIRNGRLIGGTWSRTSTAPALAHETVKVNQSTHIYIEDSEIRGANDNALDFVGVQHGHVVRSRIGNAQDWCAYVKGGSAYLVIEGNTFRDCGTGGFIAGQGTGFQFMTSPWTHYEAYGISVINNIVRDVDGAGLGVNGGFNVLMAWNTIVRAGTRSHLFEAGYGSRSCDGVAGAPDRVRCAEYLAAGGWGTTRVDDGTNYVRIPNRHVYVANNLFYNPDGVVSQYQHFAVPAPFSGAAQTGSNVPLPAKADDDLRIAGNVIWNGTSTHSLGIGSDTGCANGHPTCNAAQLVAQNSINTVRPVFANESAGDYRVAAGRLPAAVAIPAFVWIDAPTTPAAPAGVTRDAITVDFNGAVRSSADHAGALVPLRPSISTTPAVLRFAATKNGAGATTLTSVTAPQRVAVELSTGAPTWSVTASQPWVDLSQVASSYTGASSFVVGITNGGASNLIGASTALTATVTITTAGGTHTATQIAVTLTIDQTNGTATVPPFGALDTPTAGATGVTGAIAVTGWALDDVAVDRVEIWRNCVTPIDSTRPGVCRNATPSGAPTHVYVGNASFVPGARPDVETANPGLPQAYRAGWGYLLLTNALPNQTSGATEGGQGTVTLSAFAVDVENRYTLLGSRTITLNNDNATQPFGAIDTPEQGSTVTAALSPNFGWAMTRRQNAAGVNVPKCIERSRYRVFIDGVARPLTAGTNWFPGLSRADLTAAYPGLCDSANSLAAYYIDVTALGLANGLHTIGWDVYDDNGTTGTQADDNVAGIGSRFFNILVGGADAGAKAPRQVEAEASASALPRNTSREMRAAIGNADTSVWVRADDDGVYRVRLPQTGRLTVDLGGAVTRGYLVVDDELRDLPIGSTLHGATGHFYWQPAIPYFGAFELTFVGGTPGGGETRTMLEVTISDPTAVGEPEVSIASPRAGANPNPVITVTGTARDPRAVAANGISAVHVWARRLDQGPGVQGSNGPGVQFLGAAQLTQDRYTLTSTPLSAGTYQIEAYAWVARLGEWAPAATVTIAVR